MNKRFYYSAFVALSLVLVVSVPVKAAEEDYLTEKVEEIIPQVYLNEQVVTPDEYGLYHLDSGTISMDNGFQGSIELNGDYELSSPINMTGSIIILSGNFITNDEPIYSDSIFIGEYCNSTECNVYLGNSEIHTFNFSVRGDNVNLDPGSSTITTSYLFDNASKEGHKFYDVIIKTEQKEVKTTVLDAYPFSIQGYNSRTGQTFTKNLIRYEPREVTTLAPVSYGYVEGKSVFNSIKFDNKNGCYIKDAIEAETSVTVKGEVKPVDISKAVSITKPVIKETDPKIGK